MAENTKIEWATHTFNPWIGCTKVSPACDFCYAESNMASNLLGVRWGAGQPRHRTKASTWNRVHRWNAQALQDGVLPRVFCASLSDVFDNEVPVQWRLDLFQLIAECQQLDFLLLTKRIGNVMKALRDISDLPPDDSYAAGQLLARRWLDGEPPANVWLGATICNQEEADRDVPKLLGTPAALRFLSMEPLLGPVKLNPLHIQHDSLPTVDWVIVGGESGPFARPMRPDWVRSLRDQCCAAGVAFLFKQWGEWQAAEVNPYVVREAKQIIYVRHDGSVHDGLFGVDYQGGDKQVIWVGKKNAGRNLDGLQWDEVPQPVAGGDK